MKLRFERRQDMIPEQRDRRGRVERPGGVAFAVTVRLLLDDDEQRIVAQYGLADERVSFEEASSLAVLDTVAGGWAALTVNGLVQGVAARSRNLSNLLVVERL